MPHLNKYFLRRLKSGSIFNRVVMLLRNRYMKYKARPAWFDVYCAIPPYQEPRFDQRYGNWGEKIRPIYYEEDEFRVKFMKRYGMPDIINNEARPNYAQRFRQKYIELMEANPELPTEELWSKTANFLQTNGDEWGVIDLA